MQVSPYQYRKYKKIKDSVGLEGLKELLYSSDYIEKKHLSIEVKTKLYDVISNHPEYGPKKISAELNTEKYSNTILEEGRIYNELVKAKLNTKEKRVNHIKRGGKKRIKLPGTPLLTLDGQVILDYESAEKAVADKTGVEAPTDFTPTMPDTPRTTTEKRFSTSKEDDKKTEAKEDLPVEKEEIKDTGEIKEDVKSEEIETVEEEKSEEKSEEKEVEEQVSVEASEPVVEEKTEKDAEDIVEEQMEKKVADEKTESESDEKILETEEADKEDAKIVIDLDALDRAMAKKPESAEKEETVDVKPDDDEKITLELEPLEETPVKEEPKKEDKIPGFTAEEIAQLKAEKDAVLKEMGGKKRREKPREVPQKKSSKHEEEKPVPPLEIPEEKISEKRVNHFYTTVSDDIQKIRTIVDGWSNGKIQTKDLLKIGTILGMISTNPLLKSLGRVEQVFIQVIRYFEFLETHDGKLDSKLISQNSKDMLKYIEKENILNNSDKILEQINELGIKNQQFRTKVAGKKVGW